MFPHHIQTEKVPHHNVHINTVFFGKCTRWDDTAATDEEEALRWFSEKELHALRAELLPSVYESAIAAIRAIKG
jgi:hypothetical protein